MMGPYAYIYSYMSRNLNSAPKTEASYATVPLWVHHCICEQAVVRIARFFTHHTVHYIPEILCPRKEDQAVLLLSELPPTVRKTNIEKTTLMPIGNLNEPVSQEIVDLGFKIVTEQKSLGITINNRASNLNRYFDEKIAKVRSLIGLWGGYNLSLTGRIAISKTMLVSQIGYIGCIITPSNAQLKTLQELIDSYVTQGTVIAKDRLYTKPRDGGLGLINLSAYVTALQCSWVKRCTVRINDVWRWRLASACNFNLDLLRKHV